MQLLNSDLRWYRDRLIALSVCALVALMLAFGLVPSTAHAATTTTTSCLGTDGSQGPLFFGPPSQGNSALNPTPASGSTVHPGDTVYAVYHDETPLLDGQDGKPLPIHDFSFTITKPDATIVPITPTFETLDPTHTDPVLNGFTTNKFGSPLAPHDDAWIPTASNSGIHPDQEFNNVVKISGQIPSDLTVAGTYTIHLQTFDADRNDSGNPTSGDCGFADWNLHLVPNFTLTKTVAEGDGASVPVGTTLHYTVRLENTSNITATAPTITDTITGTATHTVISGPTASQGTVTGSDPSWSWSPGSMTGHTSATLTLSVGITSAGTLINTAANGDDKHVVTTVAPAAEQVAAAAAAAAAQQVQAAAVTLPKAGAGPQQQGSSAPGGGGPFGASGIVATLLLALIGSVLFALRRREAEEPKA